jgi:uncharacterized OB-fold protein
MSEPAESEASVSADEWWQQVAERRLTVLECPSCHGRWLPWSPACPHCGEAATPAVIEASGRGRLYSWVGVHRSFSHPDDVPFTVAAVQLEEGPQLYGRLHHHEIVLEGDLPVVARFVGRDGRTVVDFQVESDTPSSVR